MGDIGSGERHQTANAFLSVDRQCVDEIEQEHMVAVEDVDEVVFGYLEYAYAIDGLGSEGVAGGFAKQKVGRNHSRTGKCLAYGEASVGVLDC